MNGRLTVCRDGLVHGPYTQAHRAKLLRELLLTQRVVRNADQKQGTQLIELISIEELDEIRRLWVVEKGEIEDLVPRIFTEVFGVEYPDKNVEKSPLDAAELGDRKDVCEGKSV